MLVSIPKNLNNFKKKYWLGFEFRQIVIISISIVIGIITYLGLNKFFDFTKSFFLAMIIVGCFSLFGFIQIRSLYFEEYLKQLYIQNEYRKQKRRKKKGGLKIVKKT